MYFFNKIVSRFSSKSDMNKYLILGIGNIGPEYQNTRHNIGFDALDKLATELKVSFDAVKLAFRAEAKYKGKKLILIKPNNYVNNSGKSLYYWMKKEKVGTNNILVVCDDLNLYFGNIKINFLPLYFASALKANLTESKLTFNSSASLFMTSNPILCLVFS
jgi:PTH1 family peptidyl-tRNA hydrolase